MRAVLYTLLPILFVALLLRVGMGCLVVASHSSDSFIDIHGDTAGYLQIGERMYARKAYTAGTQAHRTRGLIRPPGYPLYYALSRQIYQNVGVDLRWDLRPLIWPQIAFSLVQVAATYAIGWLVLRSVWSASIAGTIAALSPTGIAAAALPMPDSPFAACYAVAFVGFLVAMRWRPTSATLSDVLLLRGRKRRGDLLALAGLALAIAALLKPAAIYWPLLAVPILIGTRALQWSAFKTTLGQMVADLRQLFLPLAIVVGVWSLYNHQAEHVFAYSNISARNLRYGVVPKVELAAKLNRLPTQAEYVRYASRFTKRDADAVNVDFQSVAEVHERITHENRDVMRSHPIWTARVLFANLRAQLTTRYKVIHRQLPDTTLPMANRIRYWVDQTDTTPALVAWYGLMVLALPMAWLMRNRMAVGVSALCWIGFAYIVLPTASVGGEGSRLILAAEPMAAGLIAGTTVSVGHATRRFIRRES